MAIAKEGLTSKEYNKKITEKAQKSIRAIILKKNKNNNITAKYQNTNQNKLSSPNNLNNAINKIKIAGKSI